MSDVRANQHEVPPAEKPRSPGLAYRHYAPQAPLILALDASALHRYLHGEPRRDQCAVIHHSPLSGHKGPTHRLSADATEAARDLFAVLRRLDAAAPEQILVEGYPEIGIGRALMDRLRRGAAAVVS